MKVVVDNTSVANAGRALYENQPDQYDVEGLAHLIFAAILSEEILLDGSSRKLSVPSLNPLLDKLKKEGLNALWTWDMAYPALADLAPMTDMFSPVRYEKLIEVIAPYLFRYFSSNKDVEHLIFKVPPVYRSPDYHDFRAFEIMEENIRNSLEGELSDDGFHCALYAWRGIYYHEFAKEICVVYFPNPRRSQFIKDIMLPGELIQNYPPDVLTFLTQTLQKTQNKLIKAINEDPDSDNSIYLPAILSFVINQCKNSRSEIIDVVADIRNSPEAKHLRHWIDKYVTIASEGNLLELRKHRNEVLVAMKQFEKRYGLEKSYIKIAPKIPLLDVSLPQILSIKIPDVLFEVINKKPALALMWIFSKSGVIDSKTIDNLTKLKPISYPKKTTEWLVIDHFFEKETMNSHLPDNARLRNGKLEDEGWRKKTF